MTQMLRIVAAVGPLLAVGARAQNPLETRLASPPVVGYTLRVDPGDLTHFDVAVRLKNLPDTFRLAMAAHPEYDDRFFRYVEDLEVAAAAGPGRVVREDSAVWRVVAPGGTATVRYRIRLPAPAAGNRAGWRPFLSATGGLVGGPHSFMYVLGGELAPAHVRLELPAGWGVATGLTPTADPHTFFAASADALMDSPIFAGRFHDWRFAVDDVPHRVVYWSSPDAAPFDTAAFVRQIEGVVRQAVDLFGRAPYRDYTFVFQDGAYGGLEHLNSVTLGAPSADLASDPAAHLGETAHEFFHTWNLMRIRPEEYRSVDYRTQPPTAGLWFSEGLTLFYADLLRRRAGLPVEDSTRIAHLERLLGRYLGGPGNYHHSVEAISRVAYNAAPGSLGDYSAGPHLPGEVLGAMLDLIVRDATRGARSMDDVMRLMLERFAGQRGFNGRDVEAAVESVCGCDVTPFFEAHIRGGGRPIDFNRHLALVGLEARVTPVPAVWEGRPERDLRIFGWEPPGEGGVRLIITDPGSIWGSAGLHTGDRLVSVNDSAVTTWPALRARLVAIRLGDTVRLEVGRPGGPYGATVVVSGFERPNVRIGERPGATPAQRALRERWMRGQP